MRNSFENNGYEITLGYLHYDYETDKLSFPLQLRERHLTQGPTDAWKQGIGAQLQISLWSERDNVIIRIPLSGWRQTRKYETKLSGPNNGLLSMGFFQEEVRPCTTESGDGRTIKGKLWTHDWDRP